MNLKEALARGKLKEFAKEHEVKPADRHPMGKERLDALMDAMTKGSPVTGSGLAPKDRPKGRK